MAQNLSQLQQATTVNPDDLLLVRQNGVDKSVELNKVSNSVNLENLNKDIIPDVDGNFAADIGRSLGSSTKFFKALYADEVHVGPHSLYVNNKQVISDESSMMTFRTDVDQTILIKAESTIPGSGSGNVNIQSDSNIVNIAKGDVNFAVASTVAGKNINFTNSSLGGKINLNGFTSVNGDLSITGGLTVSGTVTQVNTTNVNIADNLLTINGTQAGTPPTSLVSGIEVERGDEDNYKFVFVELDDSFKIGTNSTLQKVATREDFPVSGGVATWDSSTGKLVTQPTKNAFNKDFGTISGTIAEGNHTHSGFASTSHSHDWNSITSKPTTFEPAAHVHNAATISAPGFMSASDKTKLDGIASGATNYLHPANHSPAIITQDANNRFVTDAEKSTWNAKQNALGFTPANASHSHDWNSIISKPTSFSPTNHGHDYTSVSSSQSTRTINVGRPSWSTTNGAIWIE